MPLRRKLYNDIVKASAFRLGRRFIVAWPDVEFWGDNFDWGFCLGLKHFFLELVLK